MVVEDSVRWERQLAVGATSLAFLAVLPALVGVAFARPWFVGISVVPMLLIVVELSHRAPPSVKLGAGLDHHQVVEGDVVSMRVRLECERHGVVSLRVIRSGGLTGMREVQVAPLLARVVEVEIESTATRWGRADVSLDSIEWRSALGLIRWVAPVAATERVWVHPRPIELRGRLGVVDTTIRTGHHVSRRGGAGNEFHSRRPFQPGDRWRDLDHRRLARGDDPWTLLRHMERSRDVMCVVDLVDDGRSRLEGPTLNDHALRAADAVVRAHLSDRDRVGAVILGDRVTSVHLSDGARHAVVLLHRLMAAAPRADGMRISSGVVLRRSVPKGASVLVISPLFEDGILEQVLDLRRHGRDVAVLHVGHDLIDVGRDSMARSDRQAADLRRLHSHAMRARLRSERIAVVAWPIDTATDVAVEQVLALHRQVVKRRR